MCCSAESLAWEEDAQGIITAITESHQRSQTCTFTVSSRQLAEKELLDTRPGPRSGINSREKPVSELLPQRRGECCHAGEKTLSALLKRSAFQGTLTTQVWESCHPLSPLTAWRWEGTCRKGKHPLILHDSDHGVWLGHPGNGARALQRGLGVTSRLSSPGGGHIFPVSSLSLFPHRAGRWPVNGTTPPIASNVLTLLRKP